MRYGALLLFLVACTSAMHADGATADHDAPVYADKVDDPIVVTPARVAQSYDESLPAVDVPGATALVPAILKTVAQPDRIQHDNRLDVASLEYAKALVAGVGPPAAHATAPQLVMFLVRSEGVLTTQVNVAVVHGPVGPATGESLASQLLPGLVDPGVRLGAAVQGDFAVAVLAHVSSVTIQPTARMEKGPFSIRAHASSPVAVTVKDHGNVKTLIPGSTGTGDLQVQLDCTGATRELWITLSDAVPSVGSVSFPITCNGEPARTYSIEDIAKLDASNVKRDRDRLVTSIINRVRMKRGHRPLHTSARLSELAASYAASLQADQRTLAERLVSDGLAASQVGWTAYHAANLVDGLEYIENDFDVAADLLRDDYTHVGVGISEGKDGNLDLVVLLAKVPGRVDTGHVAEQLTDMLVGDSSTTVRSDNLAVFAGGYAQRICTGADPSKVADEAHKALASYRVTTVNAFRTTDVATFDRAKLSNRKPFNVVGVGVVQSDRNGPYLGMICIEVLLAE